jgi:hypothetical protein
MDWLSVHSMRLNHPVTLGVGAQVNCSGLVTTLLPTAVKQALSM